MNLNQWLQVESYFILKPYLKKRSAILIGAIPGIAVNITNFNTLNEEMCDLVSDLILDISGYKEYEHELKESCEAEIWVFYLAMYYHYTVAKDELTLIDIRTTQTKLKKMKPIELYNYWQKLFELYIPADYIGYDIAEVQVNALNQLVTDYLNAHHERKKAYLNKKLLGPKLTANLKATEIYLEGYIDPLVRKVFASDLEELIVYNNKRYKGIISPTRGKPDKAGKLAAGQSVVLDKHEYRSKKVIIVINSGKAQLKAGIGLTDKAITGTPFTIEPGKKRRRISQKLAKEGEYILLQNTGDVETEYKVWMGE